MSSLPSLSKATMLQHDEKQKETSAPLPSFSNDSTSFNVSTGHMNNHRAFHQRVQFDSKRGSTFTSNLSCKYCKKTGHTVDKCYKLHGFPPNFKFTKNKRSDACVQSEALLPDFVPSSHGSFEVPGYGFNVYNHPEVHSSSLHACAISTLGLNPWIIDSGATNHMTPYKHLLHNLQPLISRFLITLPNGYKVKVISTGSLVLRTDMILHNVLLVPSFLFSLISVHKLLLQFQCLAVFSTSTCILQGLSLRRSLEIGKAANGMYVLHSADPQLSTHVPCCVSNSVHSNESAPVFNSSKPSVIHSSTCNPPIVANKSDLFWHQRLGHIPFARMKSISFLFDKISSKQPFLCIVCPMARQQRLPFYDSTIHSSVPFQLVHIDIWGPYNTSTYDGFRYFLTLVDDFTRVTWTRLLSCKSNAISILKAFFQLIKVQFKSTIQCFRDVVFHEHIFPYHSSSSLAFPPPPDFVDLPLPSNVNTYSPIPVDFTLSPTSITSVVPPSLFITSSQSLHSCPLVPEIRKSSRTVIPPAYLMDYVCNSVIPSHIPAPLTSKVSTVDLHMHEPQFYQQAVSNPAWQEAMTKEFQAIKRGWTVFQLDVNNAFLHGDLHEEVYMKMPPGLMSSGSTLVVIVVYVADILLASDDVGELNSLKSFLDDTFKIKDLGNVHYFLGLEITPHPQGYLMYQQKYTSDLLEEFHCKNFTLISTPLYPSVKLVIDMGNPISDPSTYMRLVGKLNFLEHTRPDISFSVQHLSQFLQAPHIAHMLATLHVLRYLMNAPDQGILLSASSDLSLLAYSDSDWAACAISRRSVQSKKQPTVALSSAEAEYMTLRMTVTEISWLVRLLGDLGLHIFGSVFLFRDNQAALHIAKNLFCSACRYVDQASPWSSTSSLSVQA
ncbi:uncharacterized protein LOC142162074 [Nicotiana tabacum]|uniref:Uncharacterized protein LOC142162074 n=1 Tax=Nicotiana tabacum TaxID=4097 RepID=A0AC58RP32_TOBAC